MAATLAPLPEKFLSAPSAVDETGTRPAATRDSVAVGEVPMLLEVTCLCGWQARGTQDEVVDLLTRHAWEDHHVRKTREEILAGATPVG